MGSSTPSCWFGPSAPAFASTRSQSIPKWIANSARHSKPSPAPGVSSARRESRLKVMAADGAQVVEDPDAERDDGGDREVDPKLVAEVGQAPRQQHVGDQAAEEDSRFEGPGDVGLEGAED